jgi:hypothetical protein
MSCPFKNALGVPGEGFHSTRFMGLAVGDTVGTFILAWIIIARMAGWAYLPTLIALFVLGEVLHWYFCVDTAFIKAVTQNVQLLQTFH